MTISAGRLCGPAVNQDQEEQGNQGVGKGIPAQICQSKVAEGRGRGEGAGGNPDIIKDGA